MARVEQRKATDCGIATLANALQISYEQAESAYGKQRDPGVSIQETCAVLHELGYLPVYLPLSGFEQLSGIRNAKTITPSALNAPAIVQVVSNGVLHQVFFDGKQVIDPSPKSPGPRSLGDYQAVVDCVFVLKRPVGLMGFLDEVGS
nr:hypothetical protein [Pseudomonas sp. s4]